MVKYVLCINKIIYSKVRKSIINFRQLTLYSPLRFNQEAKKLGLRFLFFRIFRFDNDIKKKLKERPEYDIKPGNTIIIPRNPHYFRWDKFITNLQPIRQFAKMGFTIFNLECLLKFPKLEDKLIQFREFKRFKFPYIPTYYATSLSHLLPLVSDKFPLIAKPRWGSLGKGIEIIFDEKALKRFANKNPVRKFIFQDFIPNQFDIRVIAQKNKIIGAMKRKRKKGIVNNYAAGAGISDYAKYLTPEIKSLAMNMCQRFDADFLGIDLLFDQNTKQLYLIEVNRFFQFEGFEKATKINIAGLIIKTLINKHQHV